MSGHFEMNPYTHKNLLKNLRHKKMFWPNNIKSVVIGGYLQIGSEPFGRSPLLCDRR